LENKITYEYYYGEDEAVGIRRDKPNKTSAIIEKNGVSRIRIHILKSRQHMLLDNIPHLFLKVF
jgi:hypothetical protein